MSIKTLFNHLVDFFRSDKAKHAFEHVASILPIALSIVRTVADLTPNRTDNEIIAAFNYYAVPFTNEILADPAAALLHLATAVVKDKLPPGTPKNIIQTAIQTAVTGYKAETEE